MLASKGAFRDGERLAALSPNEPEGAWGKIALPNGLGCFAHQRG